MVSGNNGKKLLKIFILGLLIIVIGGLIYKGKQVLRNQKYSGFTFNPTDYFPLGQGNQWKYRFEFDGEKFDQIFSIDGVEDIQGIETVKYYFSSQEATREGYKCLYNGAQGIMKYKEQEFESGDYEMFSPPGVILPTLKFNEERNYTAAYEQYNSKGTVTMQAKGEFVLKLVAVEDVTVPAGYFSDCLRFEYVDIWREDNGDYDMIKGTFWYAKGIGKVKEVTKMKEYDSEEDEYERFREAGVLISAVINNKKIGME